MSGSNGGSQLQRPNQHICYVVDDIPSAVDRWVEAFGAGPFYWLGRHIEFDELSYQGGHCVFDHSAAIGRWGEIFVELSQMHDLAPASFESAFVGSKGGGRGAAHISYLVPDASAENQRLDNLGMPAFFYARQGPIAITFHRSDLLEHAIEVHQQGEVINGIFDLIGSAAEDWDGSDPLREMTG